MNQTDARYADMRPAVTLTVWYHNGRGMALDSECPYGIFLGFVRGPGPIFPILSHCF